MFNSKWWIARVSAIAFLSCVLGATSFAQNVPVRPRRGNRYSSAAAEAPVVQPSQGNWSQVAKFIAEPVTTEGFAGGVAISGDTIVVTANPNYVSQKAAYIFEKTAVGWRNTPPIAALTLPIDAFLFYMPVAMDSDTIVLGTNSFGSNNPASVYVYVKPPGGWTNSTPVAAVLSPSDSVDGYFGESVSISGDTIVVGDEAADAFAGAAYVYVKPSGGWTSMTETAKLTASDAGPNSFTGRSVSISGSTIAAGGTGKAYVFVEPETGWGSMTQTAELTVSESVKFTSPVATSGNIVVASNAYQSDIAAAYLWEKPSSGWSNATQTATLTPRDFRKPYGFGSSISVSGDIVAVGASGRSNRNMVEEGGVYVFEKPASGWQNASSTTVLTGSDARYFALFGNSVALDGRVLVGGASYGGLFYPSSAFVFWLP